MWHLHVTFFRNRMIRAQRRIILYTDTRKALFYLYHHNAYYLYASSKQHSMSWLDMSLKRLQVTFHKQAPTVMSHLTQWLHWSAHWGIITRYICYSDYLIKHKDRQKLYSRKHCCAIIIVCYKIIATDTPWFAHRGELMAVNYDFNICLSHVNHCTVLLCSTI